jgi:hypothetical protein
MFAFSMGITQFGKETLQCEAECGAEVAYPDGTPAFNCQ